MHAAGMYRLNFVEIIVYFELANDIESVMGVREEPVWHSTTV